MNHLAESWGWFCNEAHTLACEKGWWDRKRTFLETMALVASELGEAIEAFRSPKPSAKILAFSHTEEELADIIIRIADLCKFFDLDLNETAQFDDRAPLFDACCSGNDEDRFVCCFDTLLANPLDIFQSVCVVAAGNPVERLGIVTLCVGEA